MIQIQQFQNTTAVVLENDALRVVVLPAKGGKLASVYSKAKQFELLFQNPEQAYGQAAIYAPFAQYEACGFDDAFPSIDAGGVQVNGGEVAYPDHGEIWSADFDYSIAQDRITLCFHSNILPYSYHKTVWLEGGAVRCAYQIKNTGAVAFPYIWAFHCLVNYRPNMRLLLPDGVQKIENVCATPLFGGVGVCYQYPVDMLPDGRRWDFSTVPPAQPPSVAKYYVQGQVAQGFCGYEYPTEQVCATITYDADKLPYLGFWVTAGGFRGDYNCALEPATGYYDSIATAQQKGRCNVLQAGEVFDFSLKIAID